MWFAVAVAVAVASDVVVVVAVVHVLYDLPFRMLERFFELIKSTLQPVSVAVRVCVCVRV